MARKMERGAMSLGFVAMVVFAMASPASADYTIPATACSYADYDDGG